MGDIDIKNVFFGQWTDFEEYRNILPSNITIPKQIAYKHLNYLIKKVITLKTDDSSIGLQTIQMNAKSLLMNGVYIDRITMQFGVIYHGEIDGLSFVYRINDIAFD